MSFSNLPCVALLLALGVAASITLYRAAQKPSDPDFIKQMPTDLLSWRNSGVEQSTHPDPWPLLHNLLLDLGYHLWPQDSKISRRMNATAWGPPRFNYGLSYMSSVDNDESTTSMRLSLYMSNSLIRPARKRGGIDVLLRVTSVNGPDWMSNERRALHKLATGARAHHPRNHTLPMLDEFTIGDIVFTVFPYLTSSVMTMIDSLSTSADDYINVVLQMLEATVYIHKLGIAHQDLFIDNFLIEYHPASLKRCTATRPRVFLIDFESAVEFPEDCLPEDRRVSRHFFPDFSRPLAPELTQNQEDGTPYDPFPLDIWQLGRRLVDYQTPVVEIDNYICGKMCHPDPTCRPTAKEAFDYISSVHRKIPPIDLEQPVVDSTLLPI